MKKTYYLLTLLVLIVSSSCNTKIKEAKEENLIAQIDEIWATEQHPIRSRDSLISIYGVDHNLVKVQDSIIDKNHAINEKKVKTILDKHGWPTKDMIGERGNWTICNVIQHSDNEVRIQYLPMMRQAVKDKKLEPRFLVRAEDRIATERGDLQIYGGQMKYYPETKSFNLWPVFDPENIDKRRTAIGLDSIAIFLKNRFDFKWNLEEQIKRTKEFEMKKQEGSKNELTN
ncbi:hypothetical protein H8K90_15225 [Winogradskyella echinorum]|uniref:Lipoprotein n=1 Tax=Winogradskyella echinorum TaxID=538189 RepID=A0ABR6Y4T0_9FLAO|nr:DUF6624 domain-containing protein [Winogradskyella echinorum]MBC3847748.1 hypothetical protein [Winogradskyella echinorum]MBC5752096.1 hypothetical protein [Winogradskyella echinorum]